MSAFAYGRIVQLHADPATLTGTDKLIAAVAALVPTEVIAGHSYLLGRFTTTDAHGPTTITDAPALKASLVVLLAFSCIPFVVGLGRTAWLRRYCFRVFFPSA